MKHLLIPVALAILVATGCGERECSSCAGCHAEKQGANQNAAAQAEKSFDKEAPADPAQFKAEPAK